MCLAEKHNTAARIRIEPPSSHYEVWGSTTRPPCSPWSLKWSVFFLGKPSDWYQLCLIMNKHYYERFHLLILSCTSVNVIQSIKYFHGIDLIFVRININWSTRHWNAVYKDNKCFRFKMVKTNFYLSKISFNKRHVLHISYSPIGTVQKRTNWPWLSYRTSWLFSKQ